MKAKAQQLDHFSDLDGMRGALACLVMLMHFGMDRVIRVATRGLIDRCEWDFSVDFFFVLSGFVLARSFQHRLPAWDHYFVKRTLRLAPMFLVALLAVLACGVRASGWTIIANLAILQSILGLDSINYPSWSIPFELFLPALGLVVVRVWDRWSGVLTGAVFAITLSGAIACAYGLAIGADHRMARALTGLGVGLILYRLAGHQLSTLRASPLQVSVLFATILGVMLVAHDFPPAALLFHPLVITLVLVSAMSKSAFSIGLFQALGRWSYSIYLLHIPVLMVTATMLGNDAVDHNPVVKLVLAGTTIVLASICYRVVERPTIELAKRWTRQPKHLRAV